MANLYSTTLVKTSSQFWSRTYDSALNPTAAFTYTGWVKLTSIPSGTNFPVVGMFDGDGNSFMTIGDGGKVVVLAKVGGVQLSKTGATTLSTGTWYFVSAVYNGSTLEVFLNGTTDGSAIAVGAVSTTSIPFNIGAANSGAAGLMNGQIDDVRFWSRALTSTEISNLYSGPCTFNNGSGLIGWWEFENNGNDSSGNGYTLTNNNTATFTSDVPFTCAVTATGLFLPLLGVGT